MGVSTKAYIVVPATHMMEVMKILSSEVLAMRNEVAEKEQEMPFRIMNSESEFHTSMSMSFNSLMFTENFPANIRYCRGDFYYRKHYYSVSIFLDDTGHDIKQVTSKNEDCAISLDLGYSTERQTPEMMLRLAKCAKNHFDCKVIYVENDSKDEEYIQL